MSPIEAKLKPSQASVRRSVNGPQLLYLFLSAWILHLILTPNPVDIIFSHSKIWHRAVARKNAVHADNDHCCSHEAEVHTQSKRRYETMGKLARRCEPVNTKIAQNWPSLSKRTRNFSQRLYAHFSAFPTA